MKNLTIIIFIFLINSAFTSSTLKTSSHEKLIKNISFFSINNKQTIESDNTFIAPIYNYQNTACIIHVDDSTSLAGTACPLGHGNCKKAKFCEPISGQTTFYPSTILEAEILAEEHANLLYLNDFIDYDDIANVKAIALATLISVHNL